MQPQSSLQNKINPGKRVLICDDERHLVRLLQVNLERTGLIVTPTFSGTEAIDALQSEIFDLAIVDFEMTEVNGYDVLCSIKSQLHLECLPVILLLTDASQIEELMNKEQRAVLYLTKPLNPRELLSLIQ